MPSERLRSILAGLDTGRTTTAEEWFAAADSIAKLEAVLAIEAAFEISLPEEKLTAVRTVEELDQLVAAEIAKGPVVPTQVKAPAWLAAPLPPAPVATWGKPASVALVGAMKLWFRLRVSGREHLPTDGPCLVCANHASHLDGPALLAAAGSARDRLVFTAAKDYFFARPRLARWSGRALPLIPWERGGDLGAMRQNLRHLAACRAENRIVVFFPEGSRSRDGSLQPFKDGLGFFAEQLGLPVVPAWIDGTHRALPKGSAWPKGGNLSVRFGAPVSPANQEAAAFGEVVRAQLLALKEATP